MGTPLIPARLLKLSQADPLPFLAKVSLFMSGFSTAAALYSLVLGNGLLACTGAIAAAGMLSNYWVMKRADVARSSNSGDANRRRMLAAVAGGGFALLLAGLASFLLMP